MAGFTPQSLPHWRRAVLKVGSSLLADAGGGLADVHAAGLARFIAQSREQGREVVLVSSGAVAAGRGRINAGGDGIAMKQALAALGQAALIGFWQALSAAPVAQVLLSHDDLRNRRRYLNARAALQELLRLGALPVVNENDTVAVDELKLGDNDNLAAAVASLVDADLLLIATDIGGLYSAHPQRDPDARPIAQGSGHAAHPPRIQQQPVQHGLAGTGGGRAPQVVRVRAQDHVQAGLQLRRHRHDQGAPGGGVAGRDRRLRRTRRQRKLPHVSAHAIASLPSSGCCNRTRSSRCTSASP